MQTGEEKTRGRGGVIPFFTWLMGGCKDEEPDCDHTGSNTQSGMKKVWIVKTSLLGENSKVLEQVAQRSSWIASLEILKSQLVKSLRAWIDS